jgi:hypothetical protein
MSVPEKWHYQSLFKVAAALKEIAKAAWSGARQMLRDGSPAPRRAFCYVGCLARPVSVGQRVSGPSAFGDEPAAPGSAPQAAGFEAAQSIGDAMFEIGGFQRLGQGRYNVDGTTTIV